VDYLNQPEGPTGGKILNADRVDMTSRGACAIVAGGIFLIWPALANGYPLLFSDTGSFMEQLLKPFMIWDKPWIYGPVIVALSLKLTLWLPVVAQSLLASWVVWRVQAVFHTPSAAGHLGLCGVLAIGSVAPWFVSLLMPDIFAPLTVMALFVLAFDPRKHRRWPMIALASFAIAAHLTHLVIAAACLAVVLILRPRRIAGAATPLGVAVILLVVTNLVGFGRFGLSPYGSVFVLARLAADGPANIYLKDSCPVSGYRLCDWVGRLPTDADVFLWGPRGPVWTFPGGPIALAPEASRIVVATILTQPKEVARGALANWLTQIVTPRLDDVIGDDGLDETVGVQLHAYYPAAEVDRFEAAAQRTGGLRAIAAPWQRLYVVLLVLGSAGSSVLSVWSWRNDRVLFGLGALIAVGLLSNAFAAGVLSGPHDRYQARIAWLVLLPPVMFAIRQWDGGRRVRAGPEPGIFRAIDD
jgi:hypothetical protein